MSFTQGQRSPKPSLTSDEGDTTINICYYENIGRPGKISCTELFT